MKIEFEPRDIEVFAEKVVEHLKPLLHNDSSQKPEDEILTIDEAAQLLKTNKAQIYQWVNNSRHGLGDFPYLKAGRLLRFSKKAILSWLEANSKRLENR
jgi:excisionase family DNA binding protein